jgi:hypothetical protein
VASLNYTNCTPGNMIYLDSTVPANMWYGGQLAQQSIIANTAGWGQLSQAFCGFTGIQAPLEKVKDKTMSLIESLRKEIGDWHGSLGVL